MIENYLEQASLHSTQHQDSALYYSNKAYQHARTTKDTALMGRAAYYHSYYLITNGNYAEAENLLNFNRSHAHALSDAVLGGTYYNYGTRYYLDEVYDKALENYLLSLRYYKEAENKRGLMTANLQLGVVYSKLGKTELAGYFYDQSLQYSEKAKKKHTQTISYGKESSVNKIAVSIAMLQELDQEPNNRIKANILYNLGLSYLENEQWEDAIASFKKSVDLKRQMGVADLLDQNLFYIGQAYLEQGETASAIDYLLQARTISEKRGRRAAIELALQRAYEQKGDYQTALQFIKQNDTQKSSKYIRNFSGLMRNILENSVEKFISVEEDAETITDFLALQQLVHNNSFSYRVQIDESLDAENLSIPPMFTQPFVENAIIHGVQHMENGEITVQYQDSGSTISVAIKDNGKGVAATSQNANSLHKSMGTSITKQRMENLLKSENYPVTLEVISKNEPHGPQGTTVMLTFLKKYL